MIGRAVTCVDTVYEADNTNSCRVSMLIISRAREEPGSGQLLQWTGQRQTLNHLAKKVLNNILKWMWLF